MKATVTILTFCLLFTATVSGQTISYAGKTFVNDKLDQIDFISDTVLVASFRAFPEVYSFDNDSIILKLLHHHSDMEFQHSYKLLHQSLDTLSFIYTSLDNKPDTMHFVNIQNRIVPVVSLSFLRVHRYGYMGDKQVTVRGDRTVEYLDKETRKTQKLKLSDTQYNQLLDMLSKSLVFMLPAQRSEDGDDVTLVDIEIRANNQSIISKGADLSKVHSKLTQYLFNTVAKAN